MTPIEALHDLELIVKHLHTAPSEIRTLVVWAVAEIDRQRLAYRNPTQAAMMEAVPDQFMRSIVADQRRGVSAPASMASTPGARPEPPRPGTGWSAPAPLAPPPGVALCDRLMDAADAHDRADRIVNAAIHRASRGAIAERPTESASPQPRPPKRPTD
jgi:hypothetical protein